MEMEGLVKECLKRMRFSLKHSTIFDYEKILGKWVPKFWDEEELQTLSKADIHNLIFEDMRSATPHQKKKVHKNADESVPAGCGGRGYHKKPRKRHQSNCASLRAESVDF